MSARDDSPFARWSRRKQAARRAEAPVPDEERYAETREEVPEDLPPPASEPDAAEDAEPLPRLEDLTAESDLKAFLREGVPAALRNTALRKMWSLDPVIRNYVGPAEYAWDFNKPGSMPGFGPLEAGKAVADFLSKVSRFDQQEKAAEPEPAREQEAIASSDADEAAAPERPAETSSPAEPAEPAAPPEPPSNQPQSQVADAAAPAKSTPETDKQAPPRHGSALPR